jgi:hypothetical protein
MTQFADFGPLALPRPDQPARGPDHAADGGADRSRDAAELAQARIFEGMLRSEISQLEQAARSMLDRGLKHRQRRASDGWPPDELVQLRARIDEAHRLLETLRRRFLYGPEGRDKR